jgi:Tol biopolymer transport system component
MALLVEQNGLRDLWVRDLASGAMKRLTFDAESHNYPVWTPNGEYIVMEAGDPGALVWVRADGSGREERTETVAGYPFPASLSPDGTLVTLWVDSGRTLRDIWLARIGMPSGALNIEKPKPLLSLPGSQISPRISPDGRWMAFGSDETGRSEIYVVPFATQYSGDSKKWRISKEGGLWPVWSPTGSTIYYRTDLGELMAAKYKAQGDAFVAENPRPWSEKRLATISVNANFDVALDGSVVGLFPKSEEPPVTDIKVMLNLRDAIAHAPKVEQ